MSSPLPPRPSTVPTQQKALGAFYTPPQLVEALVDWALDPDTRRVLDPSFGDGRFLRSAIDYLAAAGVQRPHTRVFGAELDPLVARHPCELQGLGVPPENLVEGDFFATNLDSWDGKRFDAIVGNPPYVRHHHLSPDSKRLARQHALRVGVALNERSDAWAYFCAALLDYLEPHGRLALVLPGAVLHAEYALPLLHALSSARGRVRLIRLQERVFEDAVERTVILTLDGRQARSGVDYREVQDVDQLRSVLVGRKAGSGNWRASPPATHEEAGTPELRLRTRLSWFVSQEVAELWNRITHVPGVRALGDLAQVRIGVVTGANRFFVLTASDAARVRGRGVRTVPIVSRGGWLNGVRWTTEDQAAQLAKPSHLLLVDPSARPRKALRQAITAAEGQEIHQRSHCRLREPWYCLRDWRAPELFLPYMGAQPPRLVVNQADATCTNAVHRVSLKPGRFGSAAIAAGSWTSLCRLSAELVGRSYGDGVLKLEPNEAVQLFIPLVPAGPKNLARIERAFKRDGLDAACAVADQHLLHDQLGFSTSEIEILRGAADELRRRRGNS
jgi:adenine-specific DNA-methyltransferase